MEILESFRMALKTLKAHKLRTFLTTLGIIIGISAVLVNVSALQGFDAFFDEQVQSLGANFITIQAGETSQGSAMQQSEVSFDEEIFDTMKNLPKSNATVQKNDVGTVSYGGETSNSIIMAVSPNYFDVSDQDMVTGYSLRKEGGNQVVLTESFATTNFDEVVVPPAKIEIGFGLSIGSQVTREFDVVGIVEDPGAFGSMMPGVYIPVSTYNNIVGEEGYSTIQLFAESPKDIEYVKGEAIYELNAWLGVRPDTTFDIGTEEKEETDEGGGPSFFGVGEASQGVVEETEGYTIVTQESVMDFANNITSTISGVAVGVASISLLVGGIGIANIMLVTVSERTREIGVMKAVGAKNRDVLGLFIMESGIIGIIGGIFGLIIGGLISKVGIPLVLGVQGIIPWSWVGISIGVSFFVGVVSGFYPALRAARMDPVEALSYE